MKKDMQYHIACKEGDMGEYVFLTGDPKRVADIASFLEDAKKVAENREFVTYTGFLEGKKVSVLSTGIGGPSAAIALEEAVALGGKTFIRIGTCGGMDVDVLAGEVVIAQAAVRQEGTTRQYVPIEFPAVADSEVTLALKESAKVLQTPFHLGIIQSKDSFYGQHAPERMPVANELLQKWDAWKKAGVLASEMECATLFCVGSVLKVRVGAILLCVWNQEREKAGLENVESFAVDRAIKVALTAMRKIINNK